MILRSLGSFLILVVLLGRADDIVAADTPDPNDDILATQDNDYLPAVPAIRPNSTVAKRLPLLYGLNAQTSGCRAVTSTVVRLPFPNPSPWLGADPLYSLMSLQC
jgi:hypothetical protein